MDGSFDAALLERLPAELRRAVLGAMPSGTLKGGKLRVRLRAPETLGAVELVEARAALDAAPARAAE